MECRIKKVSEQGKEERRQRKTSYRTREQHKEVGGRKVEVRKREIKTQGRKKEVD